MIVKVLPVGPLRCNCVILGDPESHAAIVVDPGDEVDVVLDVLQRADLRCSLILNTHTHLDHVGGNHALREATGARLMLHEADLPLYDNLRLQAEWMGDPSAVPARCPVDQQVHQGDRIGEGVLAAEVLHTPGHTPGSLCLHLDQPAPLLLSGDTLFAGSIGRTDLWGGSHQQEIESIRKRLLCLDDRTRVIPGHGPETTIGRERRSNPFLAGL